MKVIANIEYTNNRINSKDTNKRGKSDKYY